MPSEEAARAMGAEPVDVAGSPRWQRIDEPLFAWAVADADRTAIVDGNQVYSYGAVAAMAAAAARDLQQAGIRPGDRVGIYLDKTIQSVAAMYGVWSAGAIAVPINETLRTRQVAHILRHSESAAVISDPCNVARLDPGAFGTLPVLSVRLAPETDAGVPARHVGGAEPAAILYTSGSTGLPKGILISHDNLLAGARIVSTYLEITARERILSVLPFSFDYGLNQLLTSVGQGATLVLQRSHLPADICRALERHAVTGMAAVPPLWIQLMAERSPLPSLALPHLRYITNSGGVFPTELVAEYRRRLPHTRIFLMYGLSEAFRSTYLPPEEVDGRAASMGKAIPETEIYVLDENGRECGPHEVGQLVHRGPTVALGYWRDPDATDAVFRPNPFAAPGAGERVVYSGDLVRKDAEGFLYFAGRRDQLIKTQGFRVSPDEIEEAIYASGLVTEAVACGIPDPSAGQAVVVHVVPRHPETFAEADLMAYCRRELPRYMLPRMIRVHTALARTASGKIDRKGLAS